MNAQQLPFALAGIACLMSAVTELRRGHIPNLMTLPLIFVGAALSFRDPQFAYRLAGATLTLLLTLPLVRRGLLRPSATKLLLGVALTLGHVATLFVCPVVAVSLVFGVFLARFKSHNKGRDARADTQRADAALETEAAKPMAVGLPALLGVFAGFAWLELR